MEGWLNKSLNYFRKNLEIEKVDYKDLIIIVYEEYSNRNLAELIANLYNLDQTDIYFEIDSIIVNQDKKSKKLKYLRSELDRKGYNEWLESF